MSFLKRKRFLCFVQIREVFFVHYDGELFSSLAPWRKTSENQRVFSGRILREWRIFPGSAPGNRETKEVPATD